MSQAHAAFASSAQVQLRTAPGARASCARAATKRRFPVKQQPRAQTWSDPAVTREYIDFLEGKGGQPESEDGPSTIVGAGGRVGNLLAYAGEGEDVFIQRGQVIPPDAPGPVYVCTRAADMEQVIVDCPPEKLDDLVFLQNGFLENTLRRHGVDGNTRANLYFGLPELGAKAVDGRTPSDPNGLTSVTGKWADAFQQRLERVSLTCKVQFERDFRRAQLEKLIWISAFNLIGSVHGNVTMGQVASKHQSEVEEMVQEMGTMIRFTLAVGMGTGIEARLVDYARAVKDFPTSFKEFEWRNGFFYHYSKLAKSKDLRDPTPMHTGYLEDGKAMGLIDW